MILDSGTCEVRRKINIAEAGYMPVFRNQTIFMGWYAELSYETSPVWPTEGREEVQTDARIRILRNTRIGEHDLVKLYPMDPETGEDLEPELFEVRRAFRGTDDDSGEDIWDLTLIRTESGWADGEPGTEDSETGTGSAGTEEPGTGTGSTGTEEPGTGTGSAGTGDTGTAAGEGEGG